MKKTLSVILSICIFISLFSFTGCTSKKSKYIQAKQKLGMIDEDGKKVGDSITGEPEEISEAMNILNELGDYSDSGELESRAYDYYNSYYGDLAYNALNDYDFDKAEEYFKKTTYNIPDRYLMVIPTLRKVVGKWQGKYGNNNSVIVTISGPFLPVIPEYTNCDWGISVNITIAVLKFDTYPMQSFRLVQESAYYYLNDKEELTYQLIVKNNNYGEYALSQDISSFWYSKISLFPSTVKEGELCLIEDICDNNFSKVYGTGYLTLKKIS